MKNFFGRALNRWRLVVMTNDCCALMPQLEEIPALKAMISKHQQQTENLEAIVSIKSDHEK